MVVVEVIDDRGRGYWWSGLLVVVVIGGRG